MLTRIRFALKKEEPYSHLKKILGFAPHNIEIYQLALRHRSSNSDRPKDKLYNNERLEFLGDSILSAVVSDIIYHAFPNQREGELTTLRSKMVQRETLDKLAITIGLQPLIMSNSKLNLPEANGHINGNAFEALIGAIYLDRGYTKCQEFLQRLITSKQLDMERLSQADVNFKSKFIEWTQRRRVTYQISYTQVDHPHIIGAKNFCATLTVEGIVVGQGIGRSKKEADQKACKTALSNIKRKSFKVQLNQIKPDVSTL
jgi:ribonuclease-3